MYPQVKYPDYRWGMAVDSDACTGCQACVVACSAGEQRAGGGQGPGRLRPRPAVDTPRALGARAQAARPPTSSSPCSASTARSRRASRCVPSTPRITRRKGSTRRSTTAASGTRYCGNNCPYHVRRFNWFNYSWTSPLEIQLNPDVTVRQLGRHGEVHHVPPAHREGQERGARRRAGDQGRRHPDGLPADLPDPGHHLRQPQGRRSQVSKLSASPRSYHVLRELGTRPAVTYLAKVVRGDGARPRGREGAQGMSVATPAGQPTLGGRQP